MPGTLVLHVVKMDGDFDTVLGNDFVRKKELKNKILVLTHADALEKFDYEKTIKPRVRDIVSKTSEPRFAILGSFEGAHEEELLQMKKFNCLQNQHDINIGTSALNLCIEETITDHLHSQWPIAKDIIRKNLRETEEALEKMKIIHPLDILVALRGEILDNFKEQKSQLELNSIRVWMKKLKNGINGFNLEDPKVESKELDDYDVIEDGTRVRVKFLANAVGGVVPPPFIKECIITKFDPKTSLYVVHVADKPLEIHSKVPRKDICSLIENNPSKFLTHLKELLARQPGLRCESHVDIHYFIKHFSQIFSEFYDKINHNSAEELVEIMNKIIDEVFSQLKYPDIAKRAVAKLKETIKLEFKDVEMKTKEAVAQISRFNSAKFAFTPNEHYLNATFAQMIQNAPENTFLTDDGGVMLIYYHIKSYIKVSKKEIIASATYCILDCLFYDGFDAGIKKGLSNIAILQVNHFIFSMNIYIIYFIIQRISLSLSLSLSLSPCITRKRLYFLYESMYLLLYYEL